MQAKRKIRWLGRVRPPLIVVIDFRDLCYYVRGPSEYGPVTLAGPFSTHAEAEAARQEVSR